MRFALALLALVAACTQFTVRTDRDPDIDFGRYRTYAWLPPDLAPPTDQQVPDRYIGKKIVTAIDEQMTAKGYVPVGSGTPDLWVTYRLLDHDTTDEPLVPYGLWWRTALRQGTLHGFPDSYERGTLIIDVIAAKSNALVWRGMASARLLPTLPFDKAVERAQDAIAQAFKTFPPRTGTS